MVNNKETEMALIEGAAVDNVNSWISGGGFLGVLASTIWCRIKVKQQCDTIIELKKDLREKADKDVLSTMDKKNELAHNRLGDKIDALPQKIIDLIK
jgi:hypothetical protein